MKKYSVIIPAAGLGERFGQDKILYRLNNGSTVLENSVSVFLGFENIKRIIVVVSRDNFEQVIEMFTDERVVISVGGNTRTESVLKGLESVGNCDYVIIHDGARPYATKELVERVIEGVNEVGAFAYTNIEDSIVEKGEGLRVANREKYLAIQTPFCLNKAMLVEAYNESNGELHDEISLLLRCGKQPKAILGDKKNIKITTPDDIKENLFGVGYDVHRLEKGNGLKLCGVPIKFNKVPIAHSDGDIPVHALMDAILSALGKKDIGHYFPVDDPKYDGESSINMLHKVAEIMKEEKYRIVNVSICIILEKPKIAEYIRDMKKVIAQVLEIETRKVGITATTNEEVGEIGKGEAIASYASALLERI